MPPEFKQFPCKARPAVVTGFLCTLATAMPSAADTDSGFRIMSEQEADAHRRVMASMDDAAREAYRNAQYAQLRERAAANGYSLPATPPWSKPGADDNRQAEIMARHADMRARLDAHRSARQAQSEPVPDTAATVFMPTHETAGPVTAEPATAAGAAPLPPPAPAATRPPAQTEDAMQADATRPQATIATADDTTGGNAVQAVMATRPTTAARPVPPTPPMMPKPPRVPPSPAQANQDTDVDKPEAGADTLASYREQMRARFDDYLKERQAQQDENLRLQREQLESRTQNRTWFQSGPRIPPYPYPSARSYPPRYPSAPPAYRSPYWQPQR